MITGRNFFCSLIRTNSLDNVYLCFTTILLKCVFRKLKLVSAVFYQIFIFSPNDSLSKTIKNVFLFNLKSSFRSQDVQIFVFFSLPFHIFQTQKDKWDWNNLSWICLHKLADVIFGITWKPLYITPLYYTWSTGKQIFVNLFHNLKSNWSLIPGPFHFW